jgi:glycosyltransferase involved in cell wall biosynthesis
LLKHYFDKSSIFISPSLEETFGNTLLESMARKVPIIAGVYSGAIPYVLQQGKAGFLCDVSKSDEIYDTIKYVFENPEKAKAISQVAFSLLLSDYLDTEVMAKHIDLYESYMTNKNNK